LDTAGVSTDPCDIMDTEFGKNSEVNLSTAKLPLTTFEIVKERALREIAMLGNSYHNRFHTEERVIPHARTTPERPGSRLATQRN
jgi:hypothetical protein